jgi:hypothetical protein
MHSLLSPRRLLPPLHYFRFATPAFTLSAAFRHDAAAVLPSAAMFSPLMLMPPFRRCRRRRR